MTLAVPRSRWIRATGVAIAYCLLSSITMAWTRFDGGIASLWIASALVLAELTLHEPREWLPTLACCAVAAFVSIGFFGLGFVAAPALVAINLGEAVLATMLLRSAGHQHSYFESLDGILMFALLAGALAPAVSAVAGALVAHLVTGLAFDMQWRVWAAGHGLGMLVFTPILTLILNGDFRAWLGRLDMGRRIEAIGFLGLTAVASWLVFATDRFPLLFLPMLPMMLATFRLERVGAAVSLVILASIGGYLSASGEGPLGLIDASPSERTIFFQIYIAVTMLIVLPVAAELKYRKILFRRLTESEARYKLITESSTDIVLTIDADGLIRYVSPSIREIGGHDPAALMGSQSMNLVYPPDRAAVARMHHQALANPGATFTEEYRAPTASGELKWFESHCRAIFTEGSATGAVSAIRDISQRKSLEMRLAHAATTDALTGLANRRAFDVQLDRMIDDRDAGRAGGCVAIFDIDLFKAVNDAHGHGVGDMVLEGFAAAARRVVGTDHHVARLGGEEFGLLLVDTDLVQARRICDRLRSAVEQTQTPVPGGGHVGVTVSAGLAPITTAPRRQIMRAADEALYRAKAAGRNRLAVAA